MIPWALPDPAWSGWRLYQGELWSPEQERWTPAHVRALPYLLEALAERRILAQRRIRLRACGPKTINNGIPGGATAFRKADYRLPNSANSGTG